tara:strand:+ start:212 stop:976 length:765 start_codon:yes stop_codon:yes gene_type:complete
LTGADIAWSATAVLATATDAFVIGTDNGDTSGSTAWTAGTAQVETATCAGTVTAGGNASVVVTAAGLTGSPKTLSVAVATSDTATAWAAKVRTALAADVDVAAMFAVSGATDAVILTRRTSITVPTGTLELYAANDATLNISLDNDTCTGITTAATSANTTAGVITDGSKVYDGDQLDFEGVTIPTAASMQGVLIRCTAGAVTQTSTDEDAKLSSGEWRLAANASGIASLLADLTFTATTAPAVIEITAIAKTT